MDVVLCVSGVLCELWLLFFSQLTHYFKGLKDFINLEQMRCLKMHFMLTCFRFLLIDWILNEKESLRPKHLIIPHVNISPLQLQNVEAIHFLFLAKFWLMSTGRGLIAVRLLVLIT